ncbi:MAG: hypothetical protein ABIC68_02605 [Candidatus Omnitrophota bacterium]
MKIKQIPLFLWFLVAANIWWLLIVLLAWTIYLSSSVDNFEGAGFLLAFMGLPASMLVSFFDMSVKGQMLLMVVFGFLQWNLVAYLIGFFVKKILDRKIASF